MTERCLTEPSKPSLSAAKQQLLARRLRFGTSQNLAKSNIKAQKQPRAPLSFEQERLWFLDQLEPDSLLYTMPLAFRLIGSLDRAALEQAFAKIFERHEILRTRFTAENGEATQLVEAQAQFQITFLEIGNQSETNLFHLLRAELKRPFNLSKDLMLRVTLFRLADDDHVLLLNMHHIASDAWSYAVLLRELTEFYTSAVTGREHATANLAIQYSDYALWQRNENRAGELKKHLAYWHDHLKDAPAVLELPSDRIRPAAQTFRGGSESLTLPPELKEGLSALARREGVTMHLLLMTAFKVLLYRYTHRDDLVIGTPVAGRTEIETEDLIGFFVKTLCVRTDLSGRPTFHDLLHQVKNIMMDAHAHQDFPFEKLVNELRPTRNPGVPPLIQIVFAFQNSPSLDLELPGLRASVLEIPTETAKFDLTLFADETKDLLNLNAEYNADLFDGPTIAQLLRNYEVLLDAIAKNPARRISELPLLTPDERIQLVERNRARSDYPRDKTITQLFEEQAARTPDSVAVQFENEHLLYRELDERANQFAHRLQVLGVGPGVFVAVALERSIELIIALVGTLKAGGAYIALDVTHPAARLASMLEDSQPRVLVTHRGLRKNFEASVSSAHVVCVDQDQEPSERTSKAPPENGATAADIAYVSFTSGSTGGPKGVCVPHRAVARLVMNTDYLKLGPTDVVAEVSNCAFDASTFEIWGALLNGARLQVFPQSLIMAPRELGHELKRTGVTTIFVTTALFNQLTQDEPGIFANVRNVLFGGDTVNPGRIADVLKNSPPARLLHVYGPTECTTFATWHEVKAVRDNAKTVPIGRPIANTETFVLDENLEPVPIGVPGELYLGGDGLATGYLNRPELTAAKFIPHPFSTVPGDRLYRTGDMVRYDADGRIEFLGRTDLQIKLRGFRVELAEIEATLSRHPNIRDCVVTVVHDAASEKRLVAYVVSKENPHVSAEELRSFLQTKLPDYMVPAAFVLLPTLPLSANGKVNRAALPAPDLTRSVSDRRFVAPRDTIEVQLAAIWEELLAAKPIGALDNFFDLGGHSLLALRMLARVEKVMNKLVPAAALFQSPTLGEFAKAIRSTEGARPGESAQLVAIQPKGTKPPLFLVHGAGGGMLWGYANLARHLGLDQPVYAFRSRGIDGLKEFGTIQEMAAHYVACLRAFQPQGPYYVGGYCFGGNVAFEMARLLQQQGQQVGLLALLNSIPPDSHYWDPKCSVRWLAKFTANLGYLLQWHFRRTPAQRREFITWQFSTLSGRLNRLFRSKKIVPCLNASELVDLSACPEEERPLWDAHVQALFKHETKPHSAPVMLLRSRGHQFWSSFDAAYGWKDYVNPGLDVRIVAGAHEQILEEPFVQSTARELKRSLDEAARRRQNASAKNILENQSGRSQSVASVDERWRPQLELNQTQLDYPRTATLVHLFEAQVARTPEAMALIAGKERLTYRELDDRASQLAGRLAAMGVGPDVLVGVCVRRSWHMVAAILGILKAGGAYVPMDPTYPRERLAFMLADAKVSLLITQRDLLPNFESTANALAPEKIICTDGDWNPFNGGCYCRSKAAPENLAYVIYTSGSTGIPKGVAIEHRAPAALMYWAKQTYSREELSGVLAATSLCFDLSIFEIFVPLSWGGTVILADNAIALASLNAAGKATLVNTVPSAMRELLRLKAIPGSVRVVNLAGEPLPTALVDQIYHQTTVQKVYDLYGPSETTTYSTGGLRKPGQSPTIGRPLPNEQVFILDSDLQPVPVGSPGELCIGGDGLARGYLHRPELTAEKFVPHPIMKGERLYRTGDLARWRADGLLEYLGRLDHQVKIRGFRIEPGEIESVLREHPDIAEAVVIPREFQSEKRLAAYIVLRDAKKPATDSVRAHIKQRLPEHMMPADFIFLDSLPLTPNGKVDRKALLSIKETRAEGDASPDPRSSIERTLAAIWQDVLEKSEIGIHDNFFELGGHSLSAIQVVSRIRTQLEVEVPLSCLYEAPTIAKLAERFSETEWARSHQPVAPLRPTSRNGILPASFVQERFWFLGKVAPDSPAYNVPIAFRIKGQLEVQALEKALDEIVRRHEALRTTFAMRDGNLRQIIQPPFHLALKQVDLRNVAAESRDEEAQKMLRAEAQTPFDLDNEPLIRGLLVRFDVADYIFGIVMHHAISDGWSLTIFFKELEKFHDAFVRNLPLPELPAVLIQPADHAQWQRDVCGGESLKTELAWWKETLNGAPPSVQLPVDSVAAQQQKAGRAVAQLPKEFGAAITALGKTQGCTPFVIHLSALALTLHRWTQQSDLVLGTVVAGRNHAELEKVIGCFVNFLPLRIKIDSRETGLDVLSHTRKTVLDAQAHEECPFEKIVAAVNPKRREDRNPLYNVGLLLQNFPARMLQIAGLETNPLPVETGEPLLDLRFEVEENQDGSSVTCEYKTSLFRPETISALLNSYQAILEALVRNPRTQISGFGIADGLQSRTNASRVSSHGETLAVTATFTAEFLDEPLQHWMKELRINAAVEFAPYGQVFQQLLDPNSLLSRNNRGLNIVLVRLEDWADGHAFDGRQSALSAHISRNSRDFTAALQAAVARGSSPFIICLCPSSDKITREPERARAFRRLEAHLVETLRKLSHVEVVTSSELFDLYPVRDYYDPRSDQLGHVPYTSAFFVALATMIARKFHALKRPPCKVIALDCDQTLWAGICGEDGAGGVELDVPRRVLQEFMRDQLDAGRLLCLCSKNNEEDVSAVFDRFQDMPLQPRHFVARQINWKPKSENLRALARELNLGLDSFVFVDDNPMECAEAAANCPEVVALQLPENPKLIPQFLKHCWIFDQAKITTEDGKRTQFYQQNRQRDELQKQSHSFSDFLAALELKIEINELTSSDLPRASQLTFRTNQFNATSHRRSETELQSCQRDGWRIHTVRVADRFGDYGLVGVIVWKAERMAIHVDSFLLSCRALGKGVEHRMLAHLGKLAREQSLSTVDVHFVPSARNEPARSFLESLGGQFRQPLNGGFVYSFPVELAEAVASRAGEIAPSAALPVKGPMPVPTNGSWKYDRWRWIALEANAPEKILKLIGAAAPKRSHVADGKPTTELEKQLCEIWQSLLRLDRVGIYDDFFELGGRSLLAVRLFSKIEALTGKRLPIVTIFQSPTIAQLADRITKAEAAQPSSSLIVSIQSQGKNVPLFLVHGAGGDAMWGYANLSQYLGKDQPVYGIQPRATDDPEKFDRLETMAADYLKELRAFRPHGPYSLGGYCFGGSLAYEMARQLSEAGEEVSFVGLLESTPEGGSYEKMPWWQPTFLFKFTRNLRFWLKDFLGYTAEERRSLVRRKLRVFTRRNWRRLRGGDSIEMVDLDDIIDTDQFQSNELRLWKAHLGLLTGHTSKPYRGHVTILRTAAHPLFSSYEHDLGWGGLARGGVTVNVVEGSHGNIFLEPNVRDLARKLAAALPGEATELQEQRETQL